MKRILFLALFICLATILCQAQDSVKKAAAVKKPAAKPLKTGVKFKPYRYTPRTVVPGAPVAAQAAVPVRRDTIAAAPIVYDKSVNGQYQYLLTKVYRYQQPMVAALWKNVNDTINLSRRRLKDAQSKSAMQAKAIDSLTKETTAKDQTLNEANARVNAVSLLGIPIPKSTYNLIMWGLVIIFGVTAAVVLARSGVHSREARYRIKLYNELEEEFKIYKTKANEKEKKLARELQTERNKLDELLGNS